MDKYQLKKILLKTAFSCMACDGHIDEREINLIKHVHEENKLFGDVDIEDELNRLIAKINSEGDKFLNQVLYEVNKAEMSDSDQISVFQTAVKVIESDEEVEYKEIRFLKLLRTKLSISDQKILSKHPDFEQYLEKDVFAETYLDRFRSEYFNQADLPTFTKIEL